MASRDLQKRGNGSIKLTAFCVFIFCCGLVFRQQYELPGFANYHQSTDEPREHGRGSMAADSWQEPATSMQTTEYISSSSSNNINNNSDQQAVTLGKNPRELGPESHAQEDRLFEVKRFLQTEKNSPAADQQLVVDHDLGDLHDKEKEEEEEGEFRSTNSVKSKPMMSADHQEQTEEFTAVIETDSADDEDDEGSWTEGLNAHEMYTTDSAPDEQDGGEMSGIKSNITIGFYKVPYTPCISLCLYFVKLLVTGDAEITPARLAQNYDNAMLKAIEIDRRVQTGFS